MTKVPLKQNFFSGVEAVIINSEKFIMTAIIYFTLGVFAVRKLINRFVDWLLFKNHLYDLKKRRALQRRAAFGNASGFRDVLPPTDWAAGQYPPLR